VIRPLAYIAERDIARYARGLRFPLIPCRLCGSQPNLQRNAIKRMLAVWEREHPGRVQSIFSALQHVEPATLADTRQFDFAGLRALAGERALAAAAFMSDAEEESMAIGAQLDGRLDVVAIG
jgi:tRNA 2-thiocytidine biosynthesis protein TtcA